MTTNSARGCGYFFEYLCICGIENFKGNVEPTRVSFWVPTTDGGHWVCKWDTGIFLSTYDYQHQQQNWPQRYLFEYPHHQQKHNTPQYLGYFFEYPQQTVVTDSAQGCGYLFEYLQQTVVTDFAQGCGYLFEYPYQMVIMICAVRTWVSFWVPTIGGSDIGAGENMGIFLSTHVASKTWYIPTSWVSF